MNRASPQRLVLSLFLALGAICAAATAQARLLVPAQYSQIGAAVQAAAPGTIIEVQQGVYQPFVVDREVTIVGHAVDGQAPVVEVATGSIGIDFQLAAGEHAIVSRLDVRPATGAVATTGARIPGGIVSLEDCRILAGTAPPGTFGLAAVRVSDAELRLAFCRLEGRAGAFGLHALRSRVSSTKTRFFGGTMPAADGAHVVDTVLHASEGWFIGGEEFLSGPGRAGLRVLGASEVYLVDSQAVGGIGAPGGSGLVNTTTTPVELLRTGMGGGLTLGTTTRAPGSVGPTVTAPDLLGLRWSEPLYRRGTLQPGQPWGVSVLAQPATPVFLAFTFDPGVTSTMWTRQPALLPQDIALAIPLVVGAQGYASHSSSLPNQPALIGIGLWAQAVAGTSLPLEASPVSGVVVR